MLGSLRRAGEGPWCGLRGGLQQGSCAARTTPPPPPCDGCVPSCARVLCSAKQADGSPRPLCLEALGNISCHSLTCLLEEFCLSTPPSCSPSFVTSTASVPRLCFWEVVQGVASGSLARSAWSSVMPNLLCCSPASELETFGNVGSQWRWLLCSPAPKQQPWGSNCKAQILDIAGIRIFAWACMHLQRVVALLSTFP